MHYIILLLSTTSTMLYMTHAVVRVDDLVRFLIPTS